MNQIPLTDRSRVENSASPANPQAATTKRQQASHMAHGAITQRSEALPAVT